MQQWNALEMRTRKSRSIWGLALASILFSGGGDLCAGSWRMLHSEHFVVLGDAGEKELQEQARVLETFRSFLSLLTPGARFADDRPLRVIAFSGKGSLRPFLPEANGKTNKQIIGYFLGGRTPSLVTSREAQPKWRRSGSSSVTLHEFTHYFLSRNLDQVPLWLNEGLSEVYGTFRLLEDNTSAELGTPISYRLKTLRSEPLMPLEELFAVGLVSSTYHSPDRAPLFYAESWALVHLLAVSREYRARFPRLVRLLGQGTPAEAALSDVFGETPDSLLKKLNAYLHSSSLPFVQFRLEGPLAVAPVEEAVELTQAEESCFRAGLLMQLGKWEEAEKALRKSMPADSDCPQCLISRAELGLHAGKTEEAKQLLDRFDRATSDDFDLQMAAGSCRRRLEQTQEAISCFRRAALLAPGAQAPYREIGKAHLDEGHVEMALSEFRRLDDSDPQNVMAHYLTSTLMLRLRRGTEAAREAAMFLRRHRQPDARSGYALLFIFLGNLQSNDRQAALNALEEYAEWQPAEDWPRAILDYACGRLGAPALLEAATDNARETEARTYIGLDLLYTGRADEAIPHLEWVREHGNSTFVEYHLALAELERFEAGISSE